MKKLKDILQGIEIISTKGSTHININNIQNDTRLVKENDVFVAIKGFYADGHKFVGKAIENGAVALIVSEDVETPDNITVIRVEDTSKVLAIMASN